MITIVKEMVLRAKENGDNKVGKVEKEKVEGEEKDL